MDPTKTEDSPLNAQSGQNLPPEVSEFDIFEVLERELREVEVGVDDGSGAGGGVGENHRVRTDLTAVLRTLRPNLHSVLQQALPQPLPVSVPGESAEKCRTEAEVGEDRAAVVGVTAPALKQPDLQHPSVAWPDPPCTGPRSSGRCPPRGSWRPP